MNVESQCKRLIKEMKKRKVANHEMMKMYIANHTARISNIRQMGYTVNKERVYDREGKATGTFLYWIPRKRRPQTIGSAVADGMKYELPGKSSVSKMLNKLTLRSQ